MQSADTGIRMDQTLVVQTPARENNYDQRLQNFVEELNRINHVKSATVSSAVPGKPVGYVMANKRADDPEKRSRLIEMMRVDENFIPTYGLELIKGRNFSKSHPSDKQQSIILNEAGVKFFGFKSNEEAVTGSINLEGHNDQRFPVIGVIKNYHHLSLKENYLPAGLMMYSPWNWIQNRYISISINTGNLHQAMAIIEDKFKTAFPSSSFDAYFLNDYFNRQYNADKQYGRMVMFFAWLALVIVCMGILGLSSFILLRRTKEIGIRKIIGADVSQLLVMLNARFIKTLSIAFLAGIPVAWFAMQGWLQNFANRTTISWWVFAAAAGITLLVSILTVSLQSYKVVSGKMVKALRSE
jgi:putative ABC transport system permease protein